MEENAIWHWDEEIVDRTRSGLQLRSCRERAVMSFTHGVNRVLVEKGFDRFVEDPCEKFYAPVMGRPEVVPGVYFRMQLVGYFEDLDSERGIAWRCADSLSLREFWVSG